MLTLTDERVKAAIDRYTKKHGGCFFYLEPGNEVLYEDRVGCSFTFDNRITDAEFADRLNGESLHLLSEKDEDSDYSEVFYFDAEGNPTDEKNAVRCVIRECQKDGTLLRETYGICNRMEDNNNV